MDLIFVLDRIHLELHAIVCALGLNALIALGIFIQMVRNGSRSSFRRTD